MKIETATLGAGCFWCVEAVLQRLQGVQSVVEVFWKTHDPTTLNRQGQDVGTQYRSVIFYHSEEQKRLAEELKRELELAGIHKNPIVTEISPVNTFYPAEDTHQNYYNSNTHQPYCMFVIHPKLKKFEKKFKGKAEKTSGADLLKLVQDFRLGLAVTAPSQAGCFISPDDGYVNKAVRDSYLNSGVKVFSFSGSKGKRLLSEEEKELDAQKGKHMSVEGHSLLKPTAQYLIMIL